MAVGTIRVIPGNQTLSFNVTRVDGTSARLFSDYAMTAAVSLPVSVSAATSYYTTAPDTLVLSAKLGGTEVASQSGGTVTVKLDDGQVHMFAPEINFPDELLAAQSGTYVSASKIAKAPSGSAATDTANLQAAIDALPAGGQLFLPFGTYLLNAPLSITKHITIAGEGVGSNYTGRSVGGDPYTLTAPYLTGAILKMTVAATNAINITGASLSVNLSRFGILFDSGLASTGHGIYAVPTATYGTGHDNGLLDYVWEDVWVYGHDGNHYAFYTLNAMQGTLLHLRGIGGGGMFTASDGNTDAFGNLVATHPFFIVTNAGTAGGFVHSSATTAAPGCLNLMVYIRPQCNMWAAAQTAGTNPLWNDQAGAGYPVNVSVYDADLESSGSNGVTFGPGTVLRGNGSIHNLNPGWTTFGVGTVPYKQTTSATAFGNAALGAVTTGSENTAVGGSALAANSTGWRNTAVGNLALNSNATVDDCTAVGSQALRLNTVTQNTAVGSTALKSNTTGTPNTAIGYGALFNNSTGGSNTAVGWNALNANTNNNNTAVGVSALQSNTSGFSNVAIGYKAGYTNTAGNATTTAAGQTFVGAQSGQPSATASPNCTAIGCLALAGGTSTGYATAIGYATNASAAGAVAIGTDNAGTGASSSTTNVIALGTALHMVQLKNNTTGAGSAALGANCPAVTATAPYTWFKMKSSDGSDVYVPAWK